MLLDQKVADLERELARARRELEASQAEATAGRFFRKVVESSTDWLVIIDAELNVSYVSPEYERGTGRAASEYLGAHVLAHTHPEGRQRVTAWLAELVKSPHGTTLLIESRHKTSSGEWMHTEVVGRNLLADPFVRGVILITRDITAARQLREELRATQARYESVLSASKEYVWEQDLATETNDFSPLLIERLGYTREEFPRTRKEMQSIWHPDDRAAVDAARTGHIDARTSGDIEARLRTKAGEYRWYRFVGKAIYEGGRAVRLVGQATDVHERKMAQIALHDSERTFRALFEDTSVAVSVRDVDTQQFIDCNQAMLQLYGFETRDQLFGSTPDHLAPKTQPDGRLSAEVLGAYVKRALRDGVARMEWMARRRDGETFPADVRTTVIALENGRRIMQTMIEDVTERRRNVSALEQRARRDDLVSRVSRQFVQSDVELALPFALEALGTFLGADRVRLRCFFDGSVTLATVHEWSARGIHAHPVVREDGSSPILRYVADRLMRHGFFAVSDIDALQPDLRALQETGRPTTARALLILPVANQGALTGWIVVEHVDKTRAWSEDDIATARLITEIVAIGRARAEAEAKTQRRAAHDELVSEVSRRFLNDDPSAATGVTIERLGASLAAESVSLFSLDERAPRLRCTHRWSIQGASAAFEALEEYPVPPDAFVPVEHAMEGGARVASSEQMSSWLETVQRDSGKRCLFAPVGYGGQVFGLLTARARDGYAWTEDDAATIRIVGELIAVGRVRRAAEVALARATEEAVAANVTKSAFLANMSHELRTPLNGVIGMVDLLATTTLDERQRRYTEIARASANLLLSVISDVLDFSKIEAGKLELEAVLVSVSDVVEEVASILALGAEEKGLELSCQSDLALAAPLVGDPARLRQVLVNLVSNAIKFTKHGEVSVRASLVSAGAEVARVRVEVSDTGVGIPEGAQAKLFQPFTQVDASTTRVHGGTGLGLAICRQLVERMQGSIGLSSTAGEGSTFWFEVTLERPAGAAATWIERDERLAGLRVLGVDDNATNRELLREQLTATGMICETAADGFAALRMLVDAAATRPYAIAVIDHHMPKMDGRELARRVKADPRLRSMPIVMLGSVANPLDAAQQRAEHIAGYSTKPIWRKQLLRVLREALDGARAPEVARDAPAQPGAPDAETRHAMPARILLVEDSPINAEVAGEILRSAGYAFELACDGLQAVEAVKSGAYDLVLMDCQLPEVDGYEATRRIRGLEREGAFMSRAGGLPVIALTASATKDDLDRCFEAGMSDHVSKPVDARRLLAVIAARLRGGAPAAPPSSSRTPSIPVANMPRALERLAGDRGLLGRVASLFADGAPAVRAKLRAAVEARAAGDVAFAVHRLRGQASTFGGEALVAAAGALGDAAARNNWPAAEATLLGVEKELDRLLRALAAAEPRP